MARKLSRKELKDIACVVTADTLLRWYRQLVAKKYYGSNKRGPGRPRTDEVIQDLILQMATENPTWGYTRIRGALSNLGYAVGRTTIKRVLADNGIDPAPIRGEHMPWKTFIKAHWGAIAAADFFTVEVLTLFGLVRYYVLFVIDFKTRRVEIAGVVHQPYGA
ncbi:MAG: helix-turn-helix domain-containing protein, partial [Myxococcota bacterium]|nr:helix-turn-helix domain-containing protein [Myxococcota bacterium]